MKIVEAGELPFASGLALTPDDKMRGAIIERLMCDFAFDFGELRRRFGPRVEPLVQGAVSLASGELADLCEISHGPLIIRPGAWPLVGLVAAKFDAWLVLGKQRYSRAV